jgi:hypothetical protein
MIIIRLRGFLGVDCLKPGQGQAGNENEVEGGFHFVVAIYTASGARLASPDAGQNQLTRACSRPFPGAGVIFGQIGDYILRCHRK